MATSPVPNLALRRLRGSRSPNEFAAAVRRAAREIGEQVACDARYVGRVESGEIRCPNYAYERVFAHMFPGTTLTDLGFLAREEVRGRAARVGPAGPEPEAPTHPDRTGDSDHGSDVRRRTFLTKGGAGAAVASLGLGAPSVVLPAPRAGGARVGESEVAAVEEQVRRIRLLDDRHGADALFPRAAEPLRHAYALLDSGRVTREALSRRLHAGAGELALSVGWLAHDSGRFDRARSHYAEALATARVADDPALEAHAFCNSAFLASDAGLHREAVGAARAGLRAAARLSSPRLLALLTLREAAGLAGLGDRSACARSLTDALGLFEHGPREDDPAWMSFFGEPELAWLESRCHAALGDRARAARHARRAAALQDPAFTRNLALYRADLAGDLARAGCPGEAADAGQQALDLLAEVNSARIRAMLATTARVLLPQRRVPEVGAFLERQAAGPAR